MSEKEFDRGKCFTFFASYRKQGESTAKTKSNTFQPMAYYVL